MERPDSVEMSAWGVASLAGLQVGGYASRGRGLSSRPLVGGPVSLGRGSLAGLQVGGFVSLRRGLSGRPPGLCLC